MERVLQNGGSLMGMSREGKGKCIEGLGLIVSQLGSEKGFEALACGIVNSCRRSARFV